MHLRIYNIEGLFARTTTMTTLLAAVATVGIVHLLLIFLIALIGICVIAGLIYAIETWVIKSPLPNMVRMVIGLILIVVVIIIVLNNVGGF